MSTHAEPDHVRRFMALLTAAALLTGLIAVGAPAAASGTFSDEDDNSHQAAIESIAAAGITQGCNPPANDRYCPDRPVTRGEMAAFLRRLLDLPTSPHPPFGDSRDSVFADDIAALADAGITSGCNPPANDLFCPHQLVTRGEMAAFLARSLQLDSSDRDHFGDDDDSVFESDINAVARVGITRGCNPPGNDRYCPQAPVLRDQMASFLARSLDIENTGTTTTTEPRPITSTTSTTLVTTSTTIPAPGSGAFIEAGGVVVMEVESVPLANGWTRQNSSPGYTGSAYYIRTDSNTRQPGEGTLSYQLHVSLPGEYVVSIRSRRDKSPGENVANDQRNDVFVKMNSDQWWKATTHAPFGEWGWIDKKTVAHATFEPLVWSLGTGTHTFRVSGRSQYIAIDRIHVYRVPGASDLTLQQLRNHNPGIDTPESERKP